MKEKPDINSIIAFSVTFIIIVIVIIGIFSVNNNIKENGIIVNKLFYPAHREMRSSYIEPMIYSGVVNVNDAYYVVVEHTINSNKYKYMYELPKDKWELCKIGDIYKPFSKYGEIYYMLGAKCVSSTWVRQKL